MTFPVVERCDVLSSGPDEGIATPSAQLRWVFT
jgi:hypothetical protein